MSAAYNEGSGPHARAKVLRAGADPAGARAAMVLLHGRGGSAEDMLALAAELDRPGFAFLAPEAEAGSWYPERFIAPLARNEPWLSSALDLVAKVIASLEEQGLPASKQFLLGFSQGACLALEFAARNPRAWGGVAGLSGGLIGPPGTVWNRVGDFEGAPVFLGCSDVDPHIPLERVIESQEVFEALGARVTRRIYPGLGHTINEDELDFVRGMMNTEHDVP